MNKYAYWTPFVDGGDRKYIFWDPNFVALSAQTDYIYWNCPTPSGSAYPYIYWVAPISAPSLDYVYGGKYSSYGAMQNQANQAAIKAKQVAAPVSAGPAK